MDAPEPQYADGATVQFIGRACVVRRRLYDPDADEWVYLLRRPLEYGEHRVIDEHIPESALSLPAPGHAGVGGAT